MDTYSILAKNSAKDVISCIARSRSNHVCRINIFHVCRHASLLEVIFNLNLYPFLYWNLSNLINLNKCATYKEAMISLCQSMWKAVWHNLCNKPLPNIIEGRVSRRICDPRIFEECLPYWIASKICWKDGYYSLQNCSAYIWNYLFL